MKKFTSFLSAIMIMAFFGAASAASLDGTSSVKYQTNPYVFRDGDTARGIVCFGKGFTVVPATNHGSNLFLDTNISISGGIDLRGTSTMTLLRDVMLDSGVTFSDSGRIYSYGSSLIMGGDLTIPADKVVHCGGNLIINGNGHTLTLGSGAQLFLDNASTLTLRNMVVKTTHQFPGAPALTLSSTLSKLALDNVMLALSDDWYVNRGQLFIHNDVMVTGTSALVYRSTAPSFIASQGCLAFDNGTTFSFAPACNNKDLILMSDASSSIVLDGCSLKTTHTGMRLAKGRLYMNNKVALNSAADVFINTSAPVVQVGGLVTTGSQPSIHNWSPNGKYIAVVNRGVKTLQVFTFSGGSTPTQVGTNVTTGTTPYYCQWSPDGKYIAVVNRGGNTLQVFTFSGGTPTQLGSNVETVLSPGFCTWSPDGRYIAVGTYSSATNKLQVFAFSGGRPVLVGSISTSASNCSCAWSPDGKYIAVVTYEGLQVKVFSFLGGNPIEIGSVGTGSNYPYSCSWSPDGKYLAVSHFGSGLLMVYAFSGGNPTLVTTVATGSSLYHSSWSPDGRYIGVMSDGSWDLKIYTFSGSLLTLVGSVSGAGNYSCAWSPDSKYVSATGSGLAVYRVNYRPDVSTQDITKGIVWGNSAAGEAYDLDVHILSDARVEVSGKVFHDPA